MLDKKNEIMIIDDEVVNISVLSEILKPYYTVSVFKSGIEALKQIEAAGNRILFYWTSTCLISADLMS